MCLTKADNPTTNYFLPLLKKHQELKQRLIDLFIFSLAPPVFLLLVLQLNFSAYWLPMIGARQPSGLMYRSPLTAANPTQRRSKDDKS